jgi:SWI/SNF-related matrix-associated actin-dependent regulator 1 of chromatin subfamily A
MTKIHWHLSGSPYKVQEEALIRSAARMGKKGYGWALDPGLGKTATALNDFMDLHLQNKVDVMVVYCPFSNMMTWYNQAKQWGFKLPIFVWPERPNVEPPYLLVANYESLLYKSKDFVSSIMEKDDVYLVADESHRIKNYTSEYAKKMLELRNNASFTRALTGTPQVNTAFDWWPQLRFVRSDMKLSPIAFRNRYCTMGGYMGKQILKTPKNEKELSELISECFFVAKKDEWAKHLPEKLPPITLYTNLSGDLLKWYDQMHQELVVAIKRAPEGLRHAELDFDEEADPTIENLSARNIVGAMNKLQQISSGFIVDTENGRHVQLCEIEKTPKYKALMDVLKDVKGKVLIFTYFTHTTSVLFEALSKEFNCCVVRGSSDKRSVLNNLNIDKFNTDPDVKILVGSIAVTSTGHTLMGDLKSEESTCATSMFFENSYNLGDRLQAEDRNHRHGQVYPVTYYDIVSSDAEAKVVSALQNKRNIIDTIIDMVRGKGS